MSASAIVLLVLALIAALPIGAELLRKPMTRKRQERAPGRMADLAQGATHYTWSGPEGGPVVVCVHGISTPSYVFAATERHLAGMGFRVLTYDLYGRGYSDRPRNAQTLDFLLTQLRALLQHQNVGGPIVLLGFSMGAQIAIAFASEEGPRVGALVLVAPAGLEARHSGFDPWTAPVIGDWLTRVAGGWKLRRTLVEEGQIATIIPDLEKRQAAETRMRGFLPAVLSSRRNILSKSAADDLRHVQRADTPILALWGTLDPIVPHVASIGRLAEIAPDAHHVQITGAAHSLLQTHPTQVGTALRDFLKPAQDSQV